MQGKKDIKTSILPPYSIALELCIFVICKHLNFQAFLKHQGIVNLISRRVLRCSKEDLDKRVKSAKSGKTTLRFHQRLATI